MPRSPIGSLDAGQNFGVTTHESDLDNPSDFSNDFEFPDLSDSLGTSDSSMGLNSLEPTSDLDSLDSAISLNPSAPSASLTFPDDRTILLAAEKFPLRGATCKKEPGVTKILVPDCANMFAVWCPFPAIYFFHLGCGFCDRSPADFLMPKGSLSHTRADFDKRCQGSDPSHLKCCLFAGVRYLFYFPWRDRCI